MKFISEFRDNPRIEKLIRLINQQAKARSAYTFMEVCGTHTMAIARFGIKEILPSNIKLISGPGCPVCVTEDNFIINAVKIAEAKNAIITTFADMLKVPANGFTLAKKRAQGLDVRTVENPLAAISIAKQNPHREVVFLGVGFETTAPLSAVALKQAKQQKVRNFSLLSSHKRIKPTLEFLAQDKSLKLDGFILPGHVSAIIGTGDYNFLARYKLASVVAGFEVLDILYGIYKLLVSVNAHNFRVENVYPRVIHAHGNLEAKNILKEVFDYVDESWRGLGVIKNSGLKPNSGFKGFDAANKFGPLKKSPVKTKNCFCGSILKGKLQPSGCPNFETKCNPDNPLGPCMVSSEGACAAYYKYNSKTKNEK